MRRATKIVFADSSNERAGRKKTRQAVFFPPRLFSFLGEFYFLFFSPLLRASLLFFSLFLFSLFFSSLRHIVTLKAHIVRGGVHIVTLKAHIVRGGVHIVTRKAHIVRGGVHIVTRKPPSQIANKKGIFTDVCVI